MTLKNRKSFDKMLLSSLKFVFIILVGFVVGFYGTSLAEAQTQTKMTNLDAQFTGENTVRITLNLTKPGSAQSQALNSHYSVTIIAKNSPKISTVILCGDEFCDMGVEDNSMSNRYCPSDCQSYCGDGKCVIGENCTNCAGDCPCSCPDTVCAASETYSSCPEDCNACGNEICEPNFGENCNTCPPDCGCGLVQSGGGP